MGGTNSPIFPPQLHFLGQSAQWNRASAYQDWNVLAQWLSANIASLGSDPFANGAFGDGVHDDTRALQQTLNSTGGILYLRPGKTFLISSTLTLNTLGNVDGACVIIYGGGTILASTAITMMTLTSCANVFILNINFRGHIAGITCLEFVTPSFFGLVEGCEFSCSPGLLTAAITISNGQPGIRIDDCHFSNATTAIALTNATDIVITGCHFRSTSVTTPVTISGTCTYTLSGSNVNNTRALAYQSSNQTITNSTDTALSFDINSYNFNSTHSTSVNPTRFTAYVDGTYELRAQVDLSAAAGKLILSARKNGTPLTPSAQATFLMNATTSSLLQLIAIIQLVATDYVEYFCFQSSGGSTNTLASDTWGSLTLSSAQ